MRLGVDVCNTLADVNGAVKCVLGLSPGFKFEQYGLGHLGIGDADAWFRWHPEVFAEAEALPGAVEALDFLRGRGWQIYYVSARPEWARELTLEWLRRRGFPECPLVLGKPKVEVAQALGLGFFVEDAPQEAAALRRVCHVLVYGQRYNRSKLDWPGILRVLEQKVAKRSLQSLFPPQRCDKMAVKG